MRYGSLWPSPPPVLMLFNYFCTEIYFINAKMWPMPFLRFLLRCAMQASLRAERGQNNEQFGAKL